MSTKENGYVYEQIKGRKTEPMWFHLSKKRKQLAKSQRQIADMLQLAGLDVDKNAVQRVEAGKRFVSDIELKYLSCVLGLSYQTLLGDTDYL